MQADPRIAALAAHFREVEQTRMRDVPILNPALQVEVVAFQPFAQGWLGVLLTPWFMNLVCLQSVEEGATVTDSLTLELPSGAYECQRNHAPQVGEFYTCSLFSPVLQFADQAAAVLTARHVMLSLTEERMQDVRDGETSAGTAHGCSRRDFLRGKLFL